ncbi:MAG: indolepyruvate oxidoreductase subunit beta family protein [Paracoccaceae bacterium]
MTLHDLPAAAPDPAVGGIIKLAVMAVGGQGGGVLTGWIEDLARAGGFACQATSVAGVAQRTGATVYYVEMCPAGDRTPVFGLMPAAGDVDILIAAEAMEAGRAIIRGFVTPDRTVLIASTHRALAVSEKVVPGDGIASFDEVKAAAEVAARAAIFADFNAAAQDAGSVISATLFGALAASGALPFPRASFEASIRGGGRGVDASLRAFDAGFRLAAEGAAPATAAPPPPATTPVGPARLLADWDRLERRVRALPPESAGMAMAGLRKVVDFQDIAYGDDYLFRLEAIAANDKGPVHALTREAAKYLANAMAYDDVIRVADLKTRAPRFARIGREMGAEGKVMRLTEYFHPRAEEIVGLFPARLGARTRANPRAMDRIGRWFGRGRRIRTDGVPGFVALWLLGGLRFWRRRTLRHADEVAHRESWLAEAMGYAPTNYALAVEVIRARRLIKGYSDTHARGHSKFDRVLTGIAQVSGRDDAADWARRLIAAALADEEGKALDGALATIASFS